MTTKEDVLAFEKTFTDKKTYRRFLCIKLKIVEGLTQAEIAQHTGFGIRHVQLIQAHVQKTWTRYPQTQTWHRPKPPTTAQY